MRCLQSLLLANGGPLGMSPIQQCSILNELSFYLLWPESRLGMKL